MSFISSFGKRKLYLINHDPIEHNKHVDEIGIALSKFLVLQTINEFRDAIYNDTMTGELYLSEVIAMQRLRADEYCLELLVPSEAVAYVLPHGQVLVKPGFAPKILSLKMANQLVYKYDEIKGFYQETAKMPKHARRVYNYNPDRWSLFTVNSLLHPH